MTDSLAAWLNILESRHPKEIDLGLERSSQVFRAMGSPSPAPLIFTVAGTNGKGSVVAYLSAMLEAMGFLCGSYTSPHILRFNERIRIAGVDTNDGKLIDAFKQTEHARNSVPLTYFEFTTLAAFQLMHEAEIDVAVLEVGLGGRLDTVNVVDPDCTVITPIGLDHQDYLGFGREAIGLEKAGIMRPGAPVICGDREPPQSVTMQAGQLGARLLVLGEDFDWTLAGSKVCLTVGQDQLQFTAPAMPGQHQLDNLATSVTALHSLLTERLKLCGEWKSAPGCVRLPGRLTGSSSDKRFILDVGHNPMAAGVVAAHLFSLSYKRVVCVLGMLKDKDAAGVVRILDAVVDNWFCAGLEGTRGQSGAELAKIVSESLPGTDVSAFEKVSAAITGARDLAKNDDLVLVFGSFETVGAAMRELADKT